MFPTNLELQVLHTERMREAQQHRLLREFGGPSLFERIIARLRTIRLPEPAEPVAVSAPCRDAVATSR